MICHVKIVYVVIIIIIYMLFIKPGEIESYLDN